MDDVGSISIFMVNLYNPLLQRCTRIFSFHAYKLYLVRMNSFGNYIFPLSSIFGTYKKNLVYIFPSNMLALIPCKCVVPT
jgi:hypothetical protein